MHPKPTADLELLPWLERYLGRLVDLGLAGFVDRQRGGFHEALSGSRTPEDGPKRLLVQCRQIYVHSHAFRLEGRPECLAAARRGLEFLFEHYWDPRAGGWYFSVEADGTPADRTKDLYAHAFVIFALAHYYAASSDVNALERALETRRLIDERFAEHDHGGFHEALTEQLQPVPRARRQNPHMHLLEGALALANVSTAPEVTKMANRLYELMRARFLDPDTGTLGEFFTHTWHSHPAEGHIVEPGHHFEWAWILDRYSVLTGDAGALDVADRLREWAWRHGFDPVFGGVFDAVDRSGRTLRDTKRIWPQTEALKAFAVHHERSGDPTSLARLVQLLTHLRDHYLCEDGSWAEHLDCQGSRMTHRLPGSTAYHLFLGLTEARRVLTAC